MERATSRFAEVSPRLGRWTRSDSTGQKRLIVQKQPSWSAR